MEYNRCNNISSNKNANEEHITVSDVPLISFGDIADSRKDNTKDSDMRVYNINYNLQKFK